METWRKGAGITAAELLLSRERWMKVVEIDGEIYLRIDGHYAEGFGADMVEHWAQVVREVLCDEDDRRLEKALELDGRI